MKDLLQGISKEKAIRYLGITNILHGLYVLYAPSFKGIHIAKFFNNCYSHASSWAELGIQPRTK